MQKLTHLTDLCLTQLTSESSLHKKSQLSNSDTVKNTYIQFWLRIDLARSTFWIVNTKEIFMKKLMAFILTASALVGLSSCQKSSSDSQPVQTLNNQCAYNPSLCQSQVYQQGNGFYPYTYTNYGGYNTGYAWGAAFYTMNNSSYLCNCPAGTMPTYNTYGGLGCVSNQLVGGFYGSVYFGWGSGATNNQWVNIPQVSNYSGYNQSNCYNGVVQSCLVDQPGMCGSGSTCQASSAQSRLGLCVSNSSGSTGAYR